MQKLKKWVLFTFENSFAKIFPKLFQKCHSYEVYAWYESIDPMLSKLDTDIIERVDTLDSVSIIIIYLVKSGFGRPFLILTGKINFDRNTYFF